MPLVVINFLITATNELFVSDGGREKAICGPRPACESEASGSSGIWRDQHEWRQGFMISIFVLTGKKDCAKNHRARRLPLLLRHPATAPAKMIGARGRVTDVPTVFEGDFYCLFRRNAC